ncbi:MAG: hypothetical protein ACRYG8_26625 [Janthinobacterium lividum]
MQHGFGTCRTVDDLCRAGLPNGRIAKIWEYSDVNGRIATVQGVLRADPPSGHLFVFRSKQAWTSCLEADVRRDGGRLLQVQALAFIPADVVRAIRALR